MFAFTPPRPRRRPSLTPMIDVVFLLLVFFMLASQFGRDTALTLSGPSGGSGSYSGPPRLIDIGADSVRLNGLVLSQAELLVELESLVTAPSDTVILRGGEAATLQRMIDVAQTLRAAGFQSLSVVE